MDEIKDFLGTPIIIGEKAVRVNSYSHWKEFVKVTIKDIDITRDDKCYVGVISEGNTRIGWTYPERLIVQGSLKNKL